MSEKEPISEKSIEGLSDTKSKGQTSRAWRKWILWGFGGLVVLVVFGSAYMWKSEREFARQREVMQRQRDIQVQAWQDQGMSEEEIATKLREGGRGRGEFRGSPSVLRRVTFMFRRATGGGRSGGRPGR